MRVSKRFISDGVCELSKMYKLLGKGWIHESIFHYHSKAEKIIGNNDLLRTVLNP